MAHIFIVDLEMTAQPDNPVDSFVGEIVEIGLCRFDLETLEASHGASFLVHPAKTVIGPYLEELCGLTSERVKQQGSKFGHVCDMLINVLDTRKRPWASWTEHDQVKLQQQCEVTGVPYPFGWTHWDLKRLYWLMECGARGHPMGLGRALKHEKLEFLGQQHRAMDDAINAARILALMLKRYR